MAQRALKDSIDESAPPDGTNPGASTHHRISAHEAIGEVPGGSCIVSLRGAGLGKGPDEEWASLCTGPGGTGCAWLALTHASTRVRSLLLTARTLNVNSNGQAVTRLRSFSTSGCERSRAKRWDFHGRCGGSSRGGAIIDVTQLLQLNTCWIDDLPFTSRTLGRSEKSCVLHDSSTCGWSLRRRITCGCGFACSTECTGTENAGCIARPAPPEFRVSSIVACCSCIQAR